MGAIAKRIVPYVKPHGDNMAFIGNRGNSQVFKLIREAAIGSSLIKKVATGLIPTTVDRFSSTGTLALDKRHFMRGHFRKALYIPPTLLTSHAACVRQFPL